jgi:hypothetical protein
MYEKRFGRFADSIEFKRTNFPALIKGHAGLPDGIKSPNFGLI